MRGEREERERGRGEAERGRESVLFKIQMEGGRGSKHRHGTCPCSGQGQEVAGCRPGFPYRQRRAILSHLCASFPLFSSRQSLGKPKDPRPGLTIQLDSTMTPLSPVQLLLVLILAPQPVPGSPKQYFLSRCWVWARGRAGVSACGEETISGDTSREFHSEYL